MKIWKTSDFSPKRQEIVIPDIKILKLSMLTHVCGVVRGPVGSHHMVRSTLCVHLPWGGLRPKIEVQQLYLRKLTWAWFFSLVEDSWLDYRLVLDLSGSQKSHQEMLYRILWTRISDSKDLRWDKIETYPMKTDQNDEKFKIFWHSQNWSVIIPESINWVPKQFFDDNFIQNHRFYEDWKNMRF